MDFRAHSIHDNNNKNTLCFQAANSKVLREKNIIFIINVERFINLESIYLVTKPESISILMVKLEFVRAPDLNLIWC